MKVKYLGILLLALLAFYGCDDNTGTLGMDMLPDSDGIKAQTENLMLLPNQFLQRKFIPKPVRDISVSLQIPNPKGSEATKPAFSRIELYGEFYFPRCI